MSMRRIVRGMLLAAAGALLIGCAGQRPVSELRTDADRAFERANWSEAATDYRAIVERYPGDWEAQYRLGRSLLALDRLPEARQALEVAHTRRPQSHDVADALAEVMLRQGDENHLFAFLRSRAGSGRSVRDQMRLARYAEAMSDYDTARVAYLAAIEFDDGRSVEPYLADAAFAERLGDLELAVRRLRQAYAVDPRDDRVLHGLREFGEIPGPTLALPPGR